ncbi:Putative histone-lysine N-methyltransferase, H3 lysine-36 specific SET2 [Podospora comata]|uniref:Histone-lysine N-methyltransferase, H3 lysine-36 specific n=1 Tax=Podospora comata TaxID=48703 RepID=A0ABY6SKE5_PODCO|nr:Putative histone-lysine N-methyltransferase, H3 lysine-36 specific SET2 [Podospora comata]
MGEDARASGPVLESRIEERPRVNGVRLRKEDSTDSASPNNSKMDSRGTSMSPDDTKSAGETAATPDHASAPKLSRKSSQKPVRSPPTLFDHLPDVTAQACSTFQVINDCLYGSRNMGSSDHDALDCDCTEEWRNDENHACGEDSDCINRATKIECVDGDCNCGPGCQNQRFQRKQYADVSVIKTDKKGFGLRANRNLQPNDFIFEYIGEVINEPTFRNRMIKYDREGIKHFYFMSLTKSEFVDATKKGNLGRFCNHSCNPNCYVDKWVVGEKLRMGIFAGRPIRAGEELVFNYNVDRYGADPQPCYCGEQNCVGFIGGKTQTERATKLSLATIEALGIEDSGDSWDTTVAKKPRRKKVTEDDEDYVNSFQPKSLDEDGVNKVMATLMQCKEKWIAVKLLTRLQATEDEQLRHRVVRMHGYQILKTTLNSYKDDTNVVLQVLDILYDLPRITKNKIADSNIEAAIQPLTTSTHEEVAFQANRLLEEWSKLSTAYRIPRKEKDAAAHATSNPFEERRNMDRDEPHKHANNSLANLNIPTGPRNKVPQRNVGFFNGQRPPRKLPSNLPEGWHVTTDNTGRYYFYDVNGKVQWQRPTAPAVSTPKTSTKAQQGQKAVQDIIDSLTKEITPRHSATHTPQRSSTPTTEPKKEKWRSLPIEKQMKIYENTLFPHVKYVVEKFHGKLPKEDLKKFAREVNKKLVSSDYKNNRVEDPTHISSKQEKKVKKYVRDFFDRAVVKYKEQQKAKSNNKSTDSDKPSASLNDLGDSSAPTPVQDDITPLSQPSSPSSPVGGRKRKREDDDDDVVEGEEASQSPQDDNMSETPSVKRLKEEEDGDGDMIPSPPPPPPPPVDTPLSEEQRAMREQEEELRRENEEAQRMEEENIQNNNHKNGQHMDVDMEEAGGDDDKPLEHREQRGAQEVMSH